jgi:uncharacterized protein (TIGR00251 family)
VVPNAKKSSIAELRKQEEGEVHLRIRLSAPAVEGKANAELLRLLSEVLAIRKNCVTILRGDKSRSKQVQIDGITEEELWQKLQKSL